MSANCFSMAALAAVLAEAAVLTEVAVLADAASFSVAPTPGRGNSAMPANPQITSSDPTTVVRRAVLAEPRERTNARRKRFTRKAPIRRAQGGEERSKIPEVGVEPTPPCEDRILSPARLPFRHSGECLRCHYFNLPTAPVNRSADSVKPARSREHFNGPLAEVKSLRRGAVCRWRRTFRGWLAFRRRSAQINPQRRSCAMRLSQSTWHLKRTWPLWLLVDLEAGTGGLPRFTRHCPQRA